MLNHQTLMAAEMWIAERDGETGGDRGRNRHKTGTGTGQEHTGKGEREVRRRGGRGKRMEWARWNEVPTGLRVKTDQAIRHGDRMG